MARKNVLVVAALFAVIAGAGTAAVGRTLDLGDAAQQSRDRLVAHRTAQLDRFERSLRRQLASLPPLPAADPAVPSSDPRVVYVRTPSTARHVNDDDERYGEDDEEEADGGEHGELDD